MSEFKIDIDTGAWLDATGIMTTVFIGDACEPCIEIVETYEELIDKELEAHCVGDLILKRNQPDAEAFVNALAEAAEYARKKYEGMKE